MELFQILSSAVVLGVAGYFAYSAFKNMYYVTEQDKYGRRHKRDVRNGRFVKAN
jgi:hypothetical protein